MMSDEAGAPGNARVDVRERPNVLSRDLFVGGGRAYCVWPSWFHAEPVARGQRIQVALRFGLTREQPGSGRPRIAMRIVRSRRCGGAVDLVDRVLRPVHHHVEPEAE